MEISKYDKNFAAAKAETCSDKKYFKLPCDTFDLYGVFYDEKDGRFLRFPKEKAEKVSVGVQNFNTCTSGGRIRFSTNSREFEIEVKFGGVSFMNVMPLSGSCGFSLIDETDKKRVFLHTFAPSDEKCGGFCVSAMLKGDKMRNYILYFPLYNEVRFLRIGIDKNAKIERGIPYKNILPVLYYGSSITQGACASRPDYAYPAVISKWNNVDFINLGFGGQAKAEDAMVDYLAEVDCSLFVCDYDYNAPDAEYLGKTHYKLYSRYREKRHLTPVLFLSKPDVDTNGADAPARKKAILKTYRKALDSGDENIYFLDGSKLFGKKDRENCTVDGCHPNDLGYYRMAGAIYKKLKEIDKKFE